MTLLVAALVLACAALAAACGVLAALLISERRLHDPKRWKEREAAVEVLEKEFRAKAGLSPTEARQAALGIAEKEIQAEAAKLEADLTARVQEKASEALVTFMHRHLVQAASSSLAIRVELPTEDTKARIIGREGRNIRAFEQVTQTDLVIDETPSAVHISAFDPLRREAARITLINLLLDGRIHPSRIEEIHAESLRELSLALTEESEAEAAEVGITGLAKPVAQKLGELRLRSSQSQNTWRHSLECASLAKLAAQELGLAQPLRAARAALLHDIGKALGPDLDGPHALAGMRFLEDYEDDPVVLNAVGAHHYDVDPLYVESHLVILVDSISAGRLGARRDARERHFQRLADLEKLAMEFEGVSRAYAVQAGRELRVMVSPAQVKDHEMRGIARDIARRASELEYAGSLRVVVVRETRAIEVSE